MALKYALVALVAIGVTTFALQNPAPARVRFLVWTLDAVPLAGVVLFALAAGIALAGAPLLFTRLRDRARVRALEARVAELQARDAPTPHP
jgi:uncharacterized integral membrane protein